MAETYGPAPLASLDRVEWRVDGKPSGDEKDGYRARFVPYIDARDVAALLDEWVGPLNWRSRFEEVVLGGKAAMWGIVSIRDPETGEWVEKRDLGVPSDFEPAKGMVSDAFKRAGCVQWGCGRNVYDLPSIWAPCKVTPAGKAVPNAATMPAIQAELKKQDFEVTGGRATGTDPTADPETGASPLPTGRQETDLVTREDMAHLKTVMDDLTEEERQIVKADRTKKGLSIRSGQFTVGTLRWILGRAAELIEEREGEGSSPTPPTASPEVVAADRIRAAAQVRNAARRSAGGMKLAPKIQREKVTALLEKQTDAVQAQVRQWAAENGHTLDDQLQADSLNVVLSTIQSVARAHKLGNVAKEPTIAPVDPHRTLRRSQWAELEKTVAALGVEDTWPMLIEELTGQGIIAQGTTDVGSTEQAFLGSGEEHDQFLATMADQYREIRENFEERPFTEDDAQAVADAEPHGQPSSPESSGLDDVDY